MFFPWHSMHSIMFVVLHSMYSAMFVEIHGSALCSSSIHSMYCAMFVKFHSTYSAMFVKLHSMYSAMFIALHSMYNDTVCSSKHTVCTSTVLCPKRYTAYSVMFFQFTELRSSSFSVQYVLCSNSRPRNAQCPSHTHTETHKTAPKQRPVMEA